MKEQKIASIINLCLNIVMGIVLGVTGQLLNGGFSFLGFLQTMVLSMGIGYLLGSFIPVMEIGQAFSELLRAKEGLLQYLLSTLAISVLMVVVITFLCVFVQVGTAVWIVFRKVIIPFMIVGIFSIEIALYWIKRFVISLMNG